MSWWNSFTTWLGYETVRAKDAKGRFIADDKSTPDVDESKKRVYKPRKKKAVKMRLLLVQRERTLMVKEILE